MFNGYILVGLPIIVILIYVIFGPTLKKAGFSPHWCLVFLYPFLAIIMIWVFAFAKWPTDEKKQGV